MDPEDAHVFSCVTYALPYWGVRWSLQGPIIYQPLQSGKLHGNFLGSAAGIVNACAASGGRRNIRPEVTTRACASNASVLWGNLSLFTGRSVGWEGIDDTREQCKTSKHCRPPATNPGAQGCKFIMSNREGVCPTRTAPPRQVQQLHRS